RLVGTSHEVVEYFKGAYGRIRTVRVGPDGFLYLTTSNRDGRGEPAAGDDRILRIDPKQLPDT
ncbi:MAG TPA: PQQ-dependent sugar dehydrogenase, partial [Candidatus Paceibacterota bacterium]